MFSGIPFLKLFLALSIGIVFSMYTNIVVNSYAVIFGLATLFLTHYLAKRKVFVIPYFGLVLFIFLFALGVYKGAEQKQKAKVICSNQKTFVIGKVSKMPKTLEKTIKTEIELIALNESRALVEERGRALLMIEKDSLAQKLQKGDYIRFEPKFKPIEDYKNPKSFNYKSFLFLHLISQQQYLKAGNWHKIEIEKPWFDLSRISDLRTYLLKQYQKFGIKGDELSVLSALTLGYKNDLDHNIQKSYAASGAIHVLAVSGLHVGIVFVIISQLLKVLGRSKSGRILRFVASLMFIWFFALLTGGTPSVLRASLMFSFIALGLALNRTGSIYNSIFASAFLLLLYNPFLLFNLSFQLSYSAVISIVFFQPKIYSLIPVCYMIPKWIWGLTSVSIAAQLGTFPITIFYFHQFPNYFLLSNFIVIPLATMIIWLSAIFFMSLSFDLISQAIAYILKNTIQLQNYLITKIEVLPHSVSYGLYIDKVQLFILLIIVMVLMQFIWSRKASFSLILASFVLVLVQYSDYRIYEHEAQKKIAVYNIKGFTVFNLIDGRGNIFISSLEEDSKQKEFFLKPHWLSLGLEDEEYYNIDNFTSDYLMKSKDLNYCFKNEFIQFYDKRILFLRNRKVLSLYKKQKVLLDYIIIGKNLKVDISELDKIFPSKQIIVDASHFKQSLKFWEMQKAKYPDRKIYIVPREGAYIEDLEIG